MTVTVTKSSSACSIEVVLLKLYDATAVRTSVSGEEQIGLDCSRGVREDSQVDPSNVFADDPGWSRGFVVLESQANVGERDQISHSVNWQWIVSKVIAREPSRCELK